MKKSKIILEEPIKTLGEFPIKISLEHNLEVEVRVIVVEEKQQFFGHFSVASTNGPRGTSTYASRHVRQPVLRLTHQATLLRQFYFKYQRTTSPTRKRGNG